jgi:phospholipid-binding lipoprotein MlaA
VTPFRLRLAALLVAAGCWIAPAHADDRDAILAETAALGVLAATGVSGDPTGIELRNARSRLATVVIAAIAERPAERSEILAFAMGAAPGLAEGLRADASAAYPGFAADFAATEAGSPPATATAEASEAPPRSNMAPGAENAADPFEDANRVVFALNDALDTLVLRPIAAVYGTVVPLPVKTGVANFYDNLKSPVILANDLMQGDVTDGAATTLARFGINSTVGLLGFLDMADDMGLPRHDNDFGKTLHRWGAGPGIYLVLPLFGPSNARDALGTAVDAVLDPVGYLVPQEAALGLTSGKAVSKREEVADLLDELRAGSLDYYAALRGAYQQRRAQELGVPEPAAESGEDPFEEFQ